MKYVDASAVLRIRFVEAESIVPPAGTDCVVSSQIIEVEAFRAIDRERLLGHLDDAQSAAKRKELLNVLAMLDLAAVNDAVIAGARSPFAVNIRVLDALHVAAAEVLAAEAPADPWNFGRTTNAGGSRRARAD